MLPLLLVAFVVVPLAELYVIVKVGEAIGVLATIALLLADSILGGVLMRSQGRAAWRRFRAVMAQGRAPAREVLDGALIIFGGAFLLTPGFLTDVVGAVLLLPPTRALVRAALVRRVAGGLTARAVGHAPPPGAPRRGPRDFDVEGTASEDAAPRGEPRLRP